MVLIQMFLYSERIRDRLRLGKTVRAAIGRRIYKKTWVAIFDSHITTLITACVLFIFGTGQSKGLRLSSIIIGMLINLFTAVLVQKHYDWIAFKYKPRKLSI